MATMNATTLATTVKTLHDTSKNNTAKVDLSEYPENLSQRGRHEPFTDRKSSLQLKPEVMLTSLLLLTDDWLIEALTTTLVSI